MTCVLVSRMLPLLAAASLRCFSSRTEKMRSMPKLTPTAGTCLLLNMPTKLSYLQSLQIQLWICSPLSYAFDVASRTTILSASLPVSQLINRAIVTKTCTSLYIYECQRHVGCLHGLTMCSNLNQSNRPAIPNPEIDRACPWSGIITNLLGMLLPLRSHD